MKRSCVLLACAVLTSACSMSKTKVASAPVARVKAAPGLTDADGVPIERIAFRPGISSVTVEKLGRARNCSGGEGAGLVTSAGPVEVYRMQCEDGKTFLARCELRQCKAM